MFKYKKLLQQNEQYLKEYCRHIKKLKKHNVDINKLNDLILNKLLFIKFKNDYCYPNKLYAHINAYYKEHNYVVNDNNIINCLNEYQNINKCHLIYKEIEDITVISYYILLNSLVDLIKYEPEKLLRYSTRKEITIYNILMSISYLDSICIDTIINECSHTENLLLSNDEYNQLCSNTKKLYRQRIVENSSLEKISEYQYTEKLIKKNTNLYSILFKRINYYKINIITIIVSLILSIIIAILLCFISKMTLIIIPINYVIIYKIISLFIPKEILLSYDLKNIPKTMCVKYIISGNNEDIDKAFSFLEETYLENKKDNMHFTLLVDCTYCDHQIEPFDDELLEQGLNICERLNAKYGEDIFYFLYRKRCKMEPLWCGYNRKNGAIEELIKLLNKELSDYEDYQLFIGHTTFHDTYKYLAIIDNKIDIIKLINILEHPYNKPVFINNKIMYGYSSCSLNGSIKYGEYDAYHNYVININNYIEILKDKMPSNILNTSLLRNLVVTNKKEKNLYSSLAIIKNRISLFIWTLKKDNPFNKIEKIKNIHNVLDIFISILSFILFSYTYISNQSIFIVSYFSIISFIILDTPFYINIYVLLRYIFDKKYRHQIIDGAFKRNIGELITLLIVLLLGIYLKLPIVTVMLTVLIILIGLIRRDSNG